MRKGTAMQREMRRKNQQLSESEAINVLVRGTSGVLALCGADGQPYAVPLSYAYREGRLYFHCALTGHKVDLLSQNARASFCVIDQDLVVPEAYTTHYRSVIAFGEMQELTDDTQKREALLVLSNRYAPHQPELHEQEINKYFPRTMVLVMTMDHLTGKEAKELRP